eukprot:COSAG05_NODE_12831_length_452_cov_1.317280_1_plen_31_part_10
MVPRVDIGGQPLCVSLPVTINTSGGGLSICG